MADGNQNAHKRARNDDPSTLEINPKRSKIAEDPQSATYRANLAEVFAQKFGLDRATAATLVEQSFAKNVTLPSHPLPSMDATHFATHLIHINEDFTKILYASLGELVPGFPVLLDGEVKTVMTKTQLQTVGNILAQRRNFTSIQAGSRQIVGAPTNHGLALDTHSQNTGDHRGSLDVRQLNKTALPNPLSMGNGAEFQVFEATPQNQWSHSGSTSFRHSSVSAGSSSSQQFAQSQQFMQNHVSNPQQPPAATQRQTHVLPPQNHVFQAPGASLSAPGPSANKPEADGSKANNTPAGKGKGTGKKNIVVKVVPESQRVPHADQFKERMVPSLPVMEAQRGSAGVPQTLTQQIHPQSTALASQFSFDGNAAGPLHANTGSSNPSGLTYRGPFTLDQIPDGAIARFHVSMPNNPPALMQRSITHPAPPPTNSFSVPLTAPSRPLTAPIPRVAGYAAIPPVNIANNQFQQGNVQQYYQESQYNAGQFQQYNTTSFSNGVGPPVAPPMMSRSVSDDQRRWPSQGAQQQQQQQQQQPQVQYQFVETTFNNGSDGAVPSRSRSGGRGRGQKNGDDLRKQALAQNTNMSMAPPSGPQVRQEVAEHGVQQDGNSSMMVSQQHQGQAQQQQQQFNFSEAPQDNVNFPVNELTAVSHSSFAQQQQQQQSQPEANYASTFMAQPAVQNFTFAQQQQNAAQLQAPRQSVFNTPLTRPTSTSAHPHHQGYQQQQQQRRQLGNSVMVPVNQNMAQFQQVLQQPQPRQRQQAPQQTVGSLPAPVVPDLPQPIAIPTLYQQPSQVAPAAIAPTSSQRASPFSVSSQTSGTGTGPVMPVVSAPTPQVTSPFPGLVIASATSGPIIASGSGSSASALATPPAPAGGEAGEYHPDYDAMDSSLDDLFGGALSSPVLNDHEKW